MTLRLERSECFWADLERRVDWYRDQAGPETAGLFVSAAQSTLTALCQPPGLGRHRFKTSPELSGIHSFRIQPPSTGT
jgi:plasmid stabilization system protein ParE